jgi:hypothetical protein
VPLSALSVVEAWERGRDEVKQNPAARLGIKAATPPTARLRTTGGASMR